jgi:hypothetical protein
MFLNLIMPNADTDLRFKVLVNIDEGISFLGLKLHHIHMKEQKSLLHTHIKRSFRYFEPVTFTTLLFVTRRMQL